MQLNILKSSRMKPSRWAWAGYALVMLLGMILLAAIGMPAWAAGLEEPSKALQVVNAAIEAMGGPAYRNVQNVSSSGRYFMFREGRKGFTRFADWTVYQDPVRWRFQLAKGKRQTLQVYNLGLNKGWVLEGLFKLEPVTEEDLKDFRRIVKRDMDYLLRNRLEEEGLKMFYYGPDDVAGSGELEAVEFLDEANDSVVIYFNRDSHLPVRTETQVTNRMGVRYKSETEFYNWHNIKGVLTPLRLDMLSDGELTQQRHIEELDYNVPIPESFFLEPEVKEEKKKKK
jgi:hypothetical protein